MFRHLIVTLSGYFGQFVIGLGSAILAARLLGPEARGELAAIMLLPMILTQLVGLGTPHAVTYYTAREPARAGELLGAALAVSMLASIPVCLIAIPAQEHLLQGFRPAVISASLVYLLSIPVAAAYGTPWGTFLALKDYRSFNVLRVLPNVIYLLSVCYAFIDPDPVPILWTNLAGLAAVAVPAVWIAYRARVRQSLRFGMASLRHMFRYSATSLTTMLPQLAGQRLDHFVVLAALDSASVGYYAVAAGVGQMLFTLQSAVGAILLPYLAADDQSSRARLFSRLFRITFAVSLAAVMVIGAVLPYLIEFLFGAAFAQATAPGAILLAAFALMGLNQVLTDGFRGLGRPGLHVASETITLLGKIAVLVAVYADLRLSGAAWASFSGAALALAFNLTAYHVVVERISAAWCAAFVDDLRFAVSRLLARLAPAQDRS